MSVWRSYVVPQWKDSKGGTARPYCTTYPQTIATISPYNSLISAMESVSACGVEAVVLQSAGTRTPHSGTSTHPLVTDVLRIQVKNSVSTGFIAIPGPITSIFKADGVTLDLTNALVIALGVQIFATLGDGQGNAWTSIVGGQRRTIVQGPGSVY